MKFLIGILLMLLLGLSINFGPRFFILVYLLIFFFQNSVSQLIILFFATLFIWIMFDVNVGYVFGAFSFGYIFDSYLNRHFDVILVRLCAYFLVLILLFELIGKSVFNLTTIVVGISILSISFLLRKVIFGRSVDGIFINQEL